MKAWFTMIVLLVFIIEAHSRNRNCIYRDYALNYNEGKRIINAFNLCQEDRTRELNSKENEEYYGYCDSANFLVFNLGADHLQGFYLIEIKTNTGSGGFHYWIVRIFQDSFTLTNFFQGYLECVLPSENSKFKDIEFATWTDDGRVLFVMKKQDAKYTFKKTVDISGKNINSQNKSTYLNKYRNPKFWKFLDRLDQDNP